jgi:hypothetical protein
MSQHDLATADRNPSQSNSPIHCAGRLPREEQPRIWIETERVSWERQRPSDDSARTVVAGPWSSPSNARTADGSVDLAVPAMSFGP